MSAEDDAATKKHDLDESEKEVTEPAKKMKFSEEEQDEKPTLAEQQEEKAPEAPEKTKTAKRPVPRPVAQPKKPAVKKAKVQKEEDDDDDDDDEETNVEPQKNHEKDGEEKQEEEEAASAKKVKHRPLKIVPLDTLRRVVKIILTENFPDRELKISDDYIETLETALNDYVCPLIKASHLCSVYKGITTTHGGAINLVGEIIDTIRNNPILLQKINAPSEAILGPPIVKKPRSETLAITEGPKKPRGRKKAEPLLLTV